MRNQRTVQLKDHIAQGVEHLSRQSGQEFSTVVHELLDEALKMRHVPGIYFADTPSGRTAKVTGSGLGVWEIVMGYRSVDGDWERLRAAYHWLTEHQLRSALTYAEAYPAEVEERIRIDEQWTPERLYETYPFMQPPDYT